ncbi:hypothetical protein DXG01_001138 [Tephrocybe rancida]|nr:hypothetical protein DXG01_001138 [Tephrocybe rancida]
MCQPWAPIFLTGGLHEARRFGFGVRICLFLNVQPPRSVRFNSTRSRFCEPGAIPESEYANLEVVDISGLILEQSSAIPAAAAREIILLLAGLLSLSKPKQQQQQQCTPPPQRPRAKAPAHRIPTHAESAIPSDPFAMPSSTATVTPPRPKQQRGRPPQPIPIAAPSPLPQQQQPARSVPLPHHRPAKTLLPAFEFPICDDLSDTDDAAPPTPTAAAGPDVPLLPSLP